MDWSKRSKPRPVTGTPPQFSYRVVDNLNCTTTEYFGFCRFNLKGFQQAKHEVHVAVVFNEDSQELFMASSKEGVKALGQYYLDLYGRKPTMLVFPRPTWLLWSEIGPELKSGSTIEAKGIRKAKKKDRQS